MTLKRGVQDVVGMVLMGDAVIHLLRGRQQTRAWEAAGAPDSAYNRALRFLERHPLLIAAMAGGEFAVGYALSRGAENADR